MAATRYNLSVQAGRALSRRLTVLITQGTISDLDFVLRMWARHVPDIPVGSGTVTIVAGTNDVDLYVAPEVTALFDPLTVYAYQIDAVAADQDKETIAHGRLYVGPEYA